MSDKDEILDECEHIRKYGVKNELKVEFEDKIDIVTEQLSNCIRDINFILDVELPELKLIVNKMEQ